MQLCDVINYIVLAMIVGLAIHLLCKMMNSKGGRYEHMSGTGVVSEHDAPAHAEEKKEEVKHDGSEPAMDMKRGESGMTPSGMGCTVCETDQMVDGYIRRSLLQKANVCAAKPDEKREELEKYRDDFFGFRNQCNQTSNSDDLVDRVNELYLSGNSDISRNHKGVAIKDLFDSLTKGTDLYDRQCIRLPNVDDVTQEGQYKRRGFRGETYTRDNWVYDQEKVSNGGEFYNHIYGQDPVASAEMAYTA